MPDFTNVFTFVMHPNEKRLAETQAVDGQRFTGKLVCSLTTKTPLFIPNTTNDRTFCKEDDPAEGENYHRSYDFFSYEDLSPKVGESHLEFAAKDRFCPEPVIPGSSLRGSLRSVYETLTGSCFSQVNSNEKSYKRAVNPFSPGLLSKNADGSYKLEQAVRYRAMFRKGGKHDPTGLEFNGNPVDVYPIAGLEEGQNVDVGIEEFDGKKFVNELDTRAGAGYIQLGENFSNKRFFGVFCVKDKGGSIRLKAETVKDSLDSAVEYYRKTINTHYESGFSPLSQITNTTEVRDHGGYENYMKAFESLKTGDKLPVFYRCSQKVRFNKEAVDPSEISLVPSQYSKEVHKKSIGDVLKNFSPCKSKDSLCPACSLFGMIGNNWNKASKIDVSDAVLASRLEHREGSYDIQYEGVTTLMELSDPDYHASEFYFRRPDGKGLRELAKNFEPESGNPKHTDWDPDKAVVRGGEYNAYEARLNGRKFYWHHSEGDWRKFTLPPEGRTVRNITIRPLKRGQRFEFDITFSNLSETELSLLVAAVDLGEGHWHSIGHAKPFGFGSVDITIEEIRVKRANFDQESGAIERMLEPLPKDTIQKSLSELFTDDDELNFIARQLQAVSKLNGNSNKISYPYYINKGVIQDSRAWFRANRSSAIRSTLPLTPPSDIQNPEDFIMLDTQPEGGNKVRSSTKAE